MQPVTYSPLSRSKICSRISLDYIPSSMICDLTSAWHLQAIVRTWADAVTVTELDESQMVPPNNSL
jgi:hypothetical protein